MLRGGVLDSTVLMERLKFQYKPVRFEGCISTTFKAYDALAAFSPKSACLETHTENFRPLATNTNLMYYY